MKYGLIGHPLGHSFSRELHENLGGYEYQLADIEEGQMQELLKSKGFSAINVTIPYKQKVIPFLDEMDETARLVGAVNTIVNRDGKLFGYNTDCFGMYALAKRHIDSFEGMTVLILGGGGTSKTAAYVAKHMMGAKRIIKAVRNIPADTSCKYLSYERIANEGITADVLINTTPVGMFPHICDRPVDISKILGLGLVLDAVYNPLRTRLVLDAQKAGLLAEGGLYMLTAQAAAAVELFCGKKVAQKELDRAFENIRKQRQNLVLIGMPGCGKTTIGTAAAKALEHRFVDTDAVITERYGSVPDIIRNKGEAHFRDIEEEVIAELSAQNGLVIATGGGAVLRQSNADALRLNGKTVFLDRKLENITPTDDRPLSSNREALQKLYETRYPIYKSVADIIIDANGTAEQVTEKVIREVTAQ